MAAVPINISKPFSNAGAVPRITRTSSGPEISIQKPTVQRSGTSGSPLLLQKADGSTLATSSPGEKKTYDPIPQTIKQTLSHSIERSKKEKLIVKLRPPEYTLAKLHEIISTIEKTNIENPKRGFITLLMYFDEIKNPQQYQQQQQQLRQMGRRGKFTKDASLRESANGYVSTKTLKAVGMWDDSSTEAFKININQSLNRITTDNIQATINEILPHIKTNEHKTFVVNTLVKKATTEHAFASLYAKFISQAPSDPIQNPSKKKFVEKIFDIISNPGDEDSEEDSIIGIGCAKFLASLINEKVIEDLEGAEIFQEMTKQLPQQYHPVIIEMLDGFMANINDDFILKFKDEPLWETIEKAKSSDKLGSRLFFLLVNVMDRYNKVKSGQKNETEQIIKAKDTKVEKLGLVRTAFEVYKEGSINAIYLDGASGREKKAYQARISPIDFLDCSLELFPDFLKESFAFSSFIGFVLKSNHIQHNATVEILKKHVKIYKEQQLDQDYRGIWVDFSDLLYTLLLADVITFEMIIQVRSQFPGNPSRDTIENSLKYFIYDYHDFHEPIHLYNFTKREIYDALMMPQTIKSQPKELLMSRLICVAIVRSVIDKVAMDPKCSIKSLRQYKAYLLPAYQKQQVTFEEEIEAGIASYELPFTADQVIQFLK